MKHSQGEAALGSGLASIGHDRDRLTHAYSGISISGSAKVHLGDVYQRGTDRAHDGSSEAWRTSNIETIADWFAPDHFASQNNELVACHEERCRVSFVKHNRFRAWCNDYNANLICSGRPGCGKTTLIGTAIQQLHRKYEHEPAVTIVYFYFDSTRYAEQSLRHVLAALVRQLFQERSSVPETVSKVYLRHYKRYTRPSVDELRSLLRSLVQEYSRVFMLIDALDECNNVDRSRDQLLEAVITTQDSMTGNICMLATTRNIPDILCRFSSGVQFQFEAQNEDIQRYIMVRMPELASCVRRNEALQREITSQILASVDGKTTYRPAIARLSPLSTKSVDLDNACTMQVDV